MWHFLVEEFNIFGIYPIRFLERNFADGTFFTWLFLLMIAVYVVSRLWKFGILQFGYKLTKWAVKTTVKVVRLVWAMIILSYSLLLLYIQAKKMQFSMAEYWKDRTVNTLGVTFRHVSGADDLTVSHPKYILRTLNLVKDVRYKSKDVLYKTLKLIHK